MIKVQTKLSRLQYDNLCPYKSFKNKLAFLLSIVKLYNDGLIFDNNFSFETTYLSVSLTMLSKRFTSCKKG